MTETRYLKRTIVKKSVLSSHLKEQRDLRIYLPPGYNEVHSYPVIYCQDGEEFFNFGRIATHAAQLILDEGMEPMIIVGVEVDLSKRMADYDPEGGRFSAYCNFFAEELVPFIEDQFAARSESTSRIIAGDSLGGTVSLHIALRFPHLFHNVISLSGAFYRSTQERLAAASDLSWLHIYMLIGLQETEVKTDHGVYDFLHANRKSKELLEGKEAVVHYLEKPGKHIWGFWQNELPDALRYFLE